MMQQEVEAAQQLQESRQREEEMKEHIQQLQTQLQQVSKVILLHNMLWFLYVYSISLKTHFTSYQAVSHYQITIALYIHQHAVLGTCNVQRCLK